MKLKRFDTTISSIGRKGHGRATLSLPSKGGTCKLSAAAVQTYGLKPGDTVALHQDEDSPKDWYLELRPAEHGFTLRKLSDKSSADTLVFSSADLAREMRRALGFYETGVLLAPLSTSAEMIEGAGYYSVLTLAAKPGRKVNKLKAA